MKMLQKKINHESLKNSQKYLCDGDYFLQVYNVQTATLL